MNIEMEISEYQLAKALIESSMLVVNKKDDGKKQKYIDFARDSINKLHQFFYENHEKFSDVDFVILKRLLYKLDVFDFSDEFSNKMESNDALQKRFKELRYKDITEP